MNQEGQARCHCIISHPSKPKFLAIRLSDGSWAVPWVNYPAEGFMSEKARMISNGFLEHYGLQTTVLRHLFDSRDHQCVELEVHSRKVNKNLTAIWVGSDEYQPMKAFPSGLDDPFAAWLKEKDRGVVPDNRAAWEREGWFGRASGWIHYELDRLNIQATGSVHQLRAGLYSNAVLGVNTSQGYCYFKAAYDQEPGEATLTTALARKWPHCVPGLLAVDTQKNWMLSRSYGAPLPASGESEGVSVAARSLAELQIESLRDLEEFQKLGCQRLSLKYLSEFLADIDGIFPLLSQGRTGLSEEGLRQFESAAKLMVEYCEQLAEFDIPNMLVTENFHQSNLFRHQDGYWITAWADAVISHPFLSLAKIVDQAGVSVPVMEFRKIAAAYLEPFGIYGPADRFGEALLIAAKLSQVATLLRLLKLLPRLEKGSISSRRVVMSIHSASRNLISPIQISV